MCVPLKVINLLTSWLYLWRCDQVQKCIYMFSLYMFRTTETLSIYSRIGLIQMKWKSTAARSVFQAWPQLLWRVIMLICSLFIGCLDEIRLPGQTMNTDKDGWVPVCVCSLPSCVYPRMWWVNLFCPFVCTLKQVRRQVKDLTSCLHTVDEWDYWRC